MTRPDKGSGTMSSTFILFDEPMEEEESALDSLMAPEKDAEESLNDEEPLLSERLLSSEPLEGLSLDSIDFSATTNQEPILDSAEEQEQFFTAPESLDSLF